MFYFSVRFEVGVSVKKFLLVVLVVVGIPTSIFGAYRWYLTHGAKLALEELSTIDSYNECMKKLVTLDETNLDSARKLIDSIDASYPDAKSADSKLTAMSTLAGGSAVNSENGLSAQLKKCRDELSRELTRY